eukprot:RCo020911
MASSTHSKFKHVYAEPARAEAQYSDIRISSNVWDVGNLLAANSKYVALAWASTGAGKVVVHPLEQLGRLPSNPNGLAGHTAPVLDWAFHPFDDNLIATGSEDTTVRLWSIPSGGLTGNLTEATRTLAGHSKKVGVLRFHPSANHVLATAGMDHCLKLWDVERGAAQVSIECHTDQIFSADFNLDGGQICTSSKDKRLRVVDPRTAAVCAEVQAHQGTKPQKVLWAKTQNLLVSVGFSKTLSRQLMVWDPRALARPEGALGTADLDAQSGTLLAFMDEDTGLLFLGGKGDGNLRMFELKGGRGSPLSENPVEFGSKEPQRGLCVLPKQLLSFNKGEVLRMLKLTNTHIVPISWMCPRKQAAVEFQADLYPNTFSSTPALSAAEYFAGQRKPPVLASLRPESLRSRGGAASPVTPLTPISVSTTNSMPRSSATGSPTSSTAAGGGHALPNSDER